MNCASCGEKLNEENALCPSCGAKKPEAEVAASSVSNVSTAPGVPGSVSKHLLHTGITDIVLGGLIAFFAFTDMRDIASIRNNLWMTFIPGTPDSIRDGSYFWWIAILGILIAGAGLTLIIYRNDKSKANHIIAEYSIILIAAVVFFFVAGLEAVQFLGGLSWLWLIGVFVFPIVGIHAGIKLKKS